MTGVDNFTVDFGRSPSTPDFTLMARAESVLALSNGWASGCAPTWTRASCTACPAPTWNGVRAPPVAVRRGRLRLPGVQPECHQRDQRKIIRLLVDDEPRSALRRTRPPQALVGLPGRPAAPRLSGPPGWPDIRALTRLVSSPAARSPPSSTASRRWTGRCDRAPVRAGRAVEQPPGGLEGDPRAWPSWDGAAARGAPRERQQGRPGAPQFATAASGSPPGWTTSSRARRSSTLSPRPRSTTAGSASPPCSGSGQRLRLVVG